MSRADVQVEPAQDTDHAAIWAVLKPVIRAGETYPLPRDWGKNQALAYWFSASHRVYVARLDGRLVGTYYLRNNQSAGGDHVANAGYMTDPSARGRGVATAMCEHSLAAAARLGFTAMQFNFVIANNQAAVALWTRLGFATVGRLPAAYRHPRLGLVDALVMHRFLDSEAGHSGS
ncbi:MAG: GNAT family N-acetyltransferase [Planctomycetota bacterium]